MIPSLALMLATNGGASPTQVGPLFLDWDAAGIISALGPTRPAHYCDSYHFSYSDASATVSFDGREITFTPHATQYRTNDAAPDRQMPGDVPVSPLVRGTSPIRSWTYLGYRIFALPNKLPGFVREKARDGDLVHLYRASGPKLSIFKESDGRVIFSYGFDGTV